MSAIRIGTRASKLALWQTHFVAERLKKGGIETEIVHVQTTGDKKLDVSIHKIGDKGVFTQELEDQLAEGTIDIAVHSAKDLPSRLPDGFEIIALGPREPVQDVLLSSNAGLNWQDASREIVVGTSSTRRVALMHHFFPHIKTVPVRGNLQTRWKRMEEGRCHALMLAYAGVHRMGMAEHILHHFSEEQFIPAVGQGSIAVESHARLDKKKREQVAQLVNDETASFCIRAERAFLAVLEGGCSIPAFCLGFMQERSFQLRGGIITLDGNEKLVFESVESHNKPEEQGRRLGETLLRNGGEALLEQIRNQLS